MCILYIEALVVKGKLGAVDDLEKRVMPCVLTGIRKSYRFPPGQEPQAKYASARRRRCAKIDNPCHAEPFAALRVNFAKNLQLFVFTKINADASLSMTAHFFTASNRHPALLNSPQILIPPFSPSTSLSRGGLLRVIDNSGCLC